jgi:hypothetical protein|uniref:Uncharacterized protein n=1 Tax=Fagus sylvatica TaxID=28930 RepID=A0A2N9GDF9_FAGSY
MGHSLKGNRKHIPYLNKKIDMYDEMAIVVGKVLVTGNYFAGHVDMEELGVSLDDVGHNEHGAESESSSAHSNKFKSRKRKHESSDDKLFINLSEQLKEVAVALKALNEGSVNVDTLYNEVMAIEGFQEDLLASAFDHLANDKNLRRAFLAKNDRF